MKQATWGLFILMALGGPMAAAQSGQTQSQEQVDPLAAAARRAREAKKTEKTTKVWTNDDIPKTGDGLSIIGPEAPAQDEGKSAKAADAKDGGKTPAADDKTKAADEKKQQDALKAQLDAAKDELQTEQSDLDIMQRKLTLDKQTYYGKPDYSTDTQGATDLNNEQDQIDAKQVQIGETQKQIEDLQAKLPQDSNASTDTGGAQP